MIALSKKGMLLTREVDHEERVHIVRKLEVRDMPERRSYRRKPDPDTLDMPFMGEARLGPRPTVPVKATVCWCGRWTGTGDPFESDGSIPVTCSRCFEKHAEAQA